MNRWNEGLVVWLVSCTEHFRGIAATVGMLGSSMF